ncbi:MAG: phosphatase PAP2 family protein, partial [Chloroflexi bacterium]|nr:phosphatase PAP2 family protein [Chloroflexota bacterium]
IGVYAGLAAMGLSNLSIRIINQFYFRPRPFDPLADLDVTLLFYPPTDSSFPSNAVAAAFGIAFSVWGVNHRIGTGFIIGAVLYSFARIYAGVHYPLDVIGGAFIALVITFLVFRLRDLLQPLPNWVIKAARILCLA